MCSAFSQPPAESSASDKRSTPALVQQLQQEVLALQSQLQAAERQHQQLLQALPQLVWITDAAGRTLQCSPKLQQYITMAGGSSEPIAVLAAVHPEDRDRVLALWQPKSETLQAQEIELRLRQTNGTYRWFLMQRSPTLDHQNGLQEWVCTFTNIDRFRQQPLSPMTEMADRLPEVESCQKNLQGSDSPGIDRLAQIEMKCHRLQNILMQVPAVMCALRGPTHIHELVNHHYMQLVGHADVIGHPIEQVWPELIRQGIGELLDQVYTSGEPYRVYEMRVSLNRRTKGTLEAAYFNFVFLPTHDRAGRVDGVFMHAVEVTEQVQARNRLQEMAAVAEIERDRLQQVIDVLPEGMVLVDTHCQVVLANQAAYEIMGVEPTPDSSLEPQTSGFMPQSGLFQMCHPDGRLYKDQDWPLLRSLQAGEVVHGQQSIVRNVITASETPVLISSAPLKNSNGDVIGGVAVFQDVRELKQIEAELRSVNEALSQFKNTLDLTLDGVVMFGPGDLRFFYANQGITDLLGYDEAELRQMTLQDLTSDSDRDRLMDVLDLLRQESISSYTIETKLRSRSGYLMPVELFLQFVAPMAERQRFVAITRDIQERQQAERSRLFMTEASTLLSASLDYETTLRQIAQLSVDYLADICLIDLVKEDGAFQRLAAAHVDPLKEEHLLSHLKQYPPTLEHHELIREALQTGQAQLAPHISQDFINRAAQDEHHLSILQQLQLSSAIVAPLSLQGRILGTLSLFTAASGRTYQETDILLAEDLARRAALAVENARLYRQAQDASDRLRRAIVVLGEQQQQLRTLQRLTNLLNQRLADLPELLRVMVNAVYEAIPAADFGLIVLQNAQTQRLELTATAGKMVDRVQADDSFEVGEGLIGQVFSTGESLFIQAELQQTQAALEGIPSALCAVPIESAQAGRLGVLAIGSWENHQAFDQEEQQLLVAFGEQAAIALNNAQLINALEEREEQLALQNDLLAQQNAELEQQRQQIQRQNRQLQEASRLKSQFLATMSHELRTPMNAIIGFSQLLLRQRRYPLQSQQTDMVNRILNNGKNLLGLINDILDLSKIEAGRLELNLEEFALDGLVLSTVDELRSLADQKNLSLKVYTNLQNTRVINDRRRLRQVLVNLISNAIKFTESGEVKVTVDETEDGCILILVRDTGIGIDQAELQHIFQEFRQVDQTITRRYSGTGLGLSIADWLVRMMDGKIQVESRLGEGSTFQVQFPRCVSLTSDVD